MKLFLDDWIAVNVLRSVALSTNSVAASVEPVMQQQFYSSLPGDDGFGSMDMRPTLMAHTPTTSSMLAALQNDSFGGSAMDPSSSAFNNEPFGSISYMDHSASQDDLSSNHQAGLPFTDFAGASGHYDVGGFGSQDLGLSAGVHTPASESDHESKEPVKPEP